MPASSEVAITNQVKCRTVKPLICSGYRSVSQNASQGITCACFALQYASSSAELLKVADGAGASALQIAGTGICVRVVAALPGGRSHQTAKTEARSARHPR